MYVRRYNFKLIMGINLGLRLLRRGLSSTQSILSNEVRVRAAVCKVTSGTLELKIYQCK